MNFEIKNIIPVQNITLVKTYRIAYIKFPLLNSSNTSKLNVEKVLNPPQKPIIIKNFIKLLSENLDINKKANIPNIKELAILEIRVASGLIPLNFDCVNFEIEYLDKLPSPPPRKIYKALIIINLEVLK